MKWEQYTIDNEVREELNLMFTTLNMLGYKIKESYDKNFNIFNFDIKGENDIYHVSLICIRSRVYRIVITGRGRELRINSTDFSDNMLVVTKMFNTMLQYI